MARVPKVRKSATTFQKFGGGSKSGEARIKSEALERTGEGVWGGGSVSPSPEIFWNFELQIVQSGVKLKGKSQNNPLCCNVT